jgi:hypothetical protein
MAKKLKWVETFTTTSWHECELTDEQAKLYEEDEERFFSEVDYMGYGELINDKISNEETGDFELVDE